MKRVISMILCLMLVLGMATTAFAATVDNHTDHSYEAYQIFAGDQSGTDPVLTNVKWGTGVNTTKVYNGKTVIQAVSAVFGQTFDTAEDIADFLSEDTSASRVSDAEKFAHALLPYLSTVKTSIKADGQYNLAAGYYLVVDVTAESDLNKPSTDGESTVIDARNLALLQVTNRGNFDISKKYDSIVIDKMIENTKDIEKNVGEFAYGDTVNFTLYAKLPTDLRGYETYKMVFHDNMTAGLTLIPDSFEIFIDNASEGTFTVEDDKDTTEVIENVYTWGNGTYTLNTNKTTTIAITVNDILSMGAAAGSVIEIKYDATVNTDAKLSREGCEINEYKLEFSNDPNWVPTDSNPNPPTGTTPPSEVEVYVTGVKINKVDGDGNPLKGAEFKLEGTTTNIVKVTKDVFVKYGVDETPVEGNKYWLLKDGTYTTTDPATPDIDTDGYADLTTIYKLTTQVDFVETDGGDVAQSYVGEDDGVLIFTGLKSGTYTITETTTPAGYNSIAPITVTITFDTKTEKFSYKWEGVSVADTDSYEITVINDRGSVLPETGGMGTTMFYTVGGLMVAAAAILLITKKRMGAEA